MPRTATPTRPVSCFLLALSLVCASCEEGTLVVNLFAYDQRKDEYRFKDVEITTLSNVERLEGDATVLKGGAKLIINYEKNYLKWSRTAHSVAFSAFERDGVLIPEDYDSLAMVSIYSNMEQSRFFFDEIGIPPEMVGNLPVYYLADITIVEKDGKRYKMHDNAFYMPITETEKGFFIAPFDQFQWVPMSLNSGIITHEYSHAVFDALLLDRAGDAMRSDAATNFLYGVNEGVADYMAVARTGDPDFMRHSIPEGYFGSHCNGSDVVPVDRDASGPVIYTEEIDNAARDIAPLDFCPYEIGSFLSSVLYHTARALEGERYDIPSRASRYRVARWLVGALGTLGTNPSDDFELWDLLTQFVGRIDSQEERDLVCEVISQRYALYFTQVGGC